MPAEIEKRAKSYKSKNCKINRLKQKNCRKSNEIKGKRE